MKRPVPAPGPASAPAAQRVGFLLLPDFPQICLTGAIEPLFIANWLSGSALYRWETLSLDGRPVSASNGTAIAVDAAASDDVRFDALFLLASFDVKRQIGDRRLRAWLRRVARHGAAMGAIETGAELLAAAGLLEDQPVAIHWDNLQGFQESHGGTRAVEQLYTMTPGRLTCAGGSAVFDMMLAWIRERHGEALAAEIAGHLLLDRIRPAETPQPVPGAVPAQAADPKLRQALALMEQSIEEPLPCPVIAERVGLSMRQLQRLFERALGSAPACHYMQIRLARAHALLQQTDLGVTEIAMSAGFGSLEHFSRVYRARFGLAPSRDRRQTVSAPTMRRG
ncbi:MAG TPA: GlxA family transcriptional regulator [Hypericibacter adhaerens]|uniref:GlxA family transcriptional regulator n=1 Tax=Hypericibacter adhaerens TaxID=2602016 RepID=UPI0012474669|nr:GlxA family transcriptional regulator [Hypericibacter adhaerens]HWA42815.1 GlxA family transcriptional regulator [Hypericibacter adhaerens]